MDLTNQSYILALLLFHCNLCGVQILHLLTFKYAIPQKENFLRNFAESLNKNKTGLNQLLKTLLGIEPTLPALFLRQRTMNLNQV